MSRDPRRQKSRFAPWLMPVLRGKIVARPQGRIPERYLIFGKKQERY
jgi:hypothetical protein